MPKYKVEYRNVEGGTWRPIPHGRGGVVDADEPEEAVFEAHKEAGHPMLSDEEYRVSPAIEVPETVVLRLVRV